MGEMKVKLKPGPRKRLNTRHSSVMVEDDLRDWAKSQPGGFSETVRRLLREAYQQEQQQRRADRDK